MTGKSLTLREALGYQVNQEVNQETEPEINIMELYINQLCLKGGTQLRIKTDEETIALYANEIKKGVIFDPIDVIYDGENYFPFDGFHRILAHKKIKKEKILCRILKGSQDDAKWMACQANSKHGLRRSQDDVRKAIKLALLHEKGKNLSFNTIAKHIGCHHSTVSSVQKELIRLGLLEERNTTEYTNKNGKSISQRRRSKPTQVTPEVNAIESGSAQVNAIESGSAQVNAIESGSAQVNAIESGSAQVNAIEFGSAQVNAIEDSEDYFDDFHQPHILSHEFDEE